MARLNKYFLDAFSNAGAPLANARLHMFQAGTATPKSAFSDPGLTTVHPNPVTADASGRFPAIFLNGAYRLRLEDSLGNPIRTDDWVDGMDSSVIDVKSFGAVGDGVVDDTVAFQNAIAASAPTRKAIYIPAGNYKITSPLNLTANGAQGGLIFGDGYASNLVYYPPVNGTPGAWPTTASAYGIFAAGCLNFGNDNFRGGFADFRVSLGGGVTNNACGLKFYKWYQGFIRNVTVDGFECGIHISNGWSTTIELCKFMNNKFGLCWDGLTIGTVRGNDFINNKISIYLGFNLFGDNTVEPAGYGQGITCVENTIQNSQEAAIVIKNVNGAVVAGNYTEANSAGPYPTLSSASVVGSAAFNGAEVIICKGAANVSGNSRVAVRDNSFSLNNAASKAVLGIQDVAGVDFQNNVAYANEWFQGPTAPRVVTVGTIFDLRTDVPLRLAGSGTVWDDSKFRGPRSSLPYLSVAALPTTTSITIPAGGVRSLVIPFETSSPLRFNTVSISTAGFSGPLNHVIGLYRMYLGKLVLVGSQVPSSANFIMGQSRVAFVLPENWVIPAGISYIAIQSTNPGASAVNFNYQSLNGFDYVRGDIGVSRLNMALPTTLDEFTQVSGYDQPAQIYLT